MSRVAIVFEAPRDGYGINQVIDSYRFDEPMTVGYLREILEGLPDEMYLILSHDSGYTYGSISEHTLMYSIEKEDGKWELTDDLSEAMDAYRDEEED